MEPGNLTATYEADYERYRDLKDNLNEEMERWTAYSEEVEEFIRNNS